MDAAVKVPSSRRENVGGAELSRPDRRGRLLHGYMHKTSNSLCGIKGYASLIAEGAATAGRAGRWARKIIAEVEQLEAIYRSVQDMAFPHPTTARGGDLSRALAEARDAAAARYPNLELAAAPCPRGELLLPERDLALILDELLANVAEGDGRTPLSHVRVRLNVRLGATGERLRLEVADGGTGLAAGLTAEEATEPFVTTKEGHLGVGLARVEAIAEMHGLAWSLASVPGRGTCVSIEIARPFPCVGTDHQGRGT